MHWLTGPEGRSGQQVLRFVIILPLRLDLAQVSASSRIASRSAMAPCVRRDCDRVCAVDVANAVARWTLAERRPDLGKRPGERFLDRSEGAEAEKAGKEPEAGELDRSADEAAVRMGLGRRSWDPAPVFLSPGLGGALRSARIVSDEALDDDRVLGSEARPMTLDPGHPRDNHMIAPADFDIGAALGRLRRLDTKAVPREVQDADVMPGGMAPHPGPDHDFLAILTDFHV